MEPIVTWFENTALSAFVATHAWTWPAAETLHFMGLCLLAGTVGLFDLRMLGLGRGLSMAALHRLLPWGILGFAVNLATGVVFIAGDPPRFLYSASFHFKLILILLAGLNAIAFYLVASRKVETLGPEDPVPVPAKVIASLSLLLWGGVTLVGRYMAFI